MFRLSFQLLLDFGVPVYTHVFCIFAMCAFIYRSWFKALNLVHICGQTAEDLLQTHVLIPGK